MVFFTNTDTNNSAIKKTKPGKIQSFISEIVFELINYLHTILQLQNLLYIGAGHILRG